MVFARVSFFVEGAVEAVEDGGEGVHGDGRLAGPDHNLGGHAGDHLDVAEFLELDLVDADLGGVIGLVGVLVDQAVGGAVIDRIGRKRVVYFANMIIAVMTIALIFCGTIAQTLLVGIVFGLGYGAYISVDWALGTDVLPNKKDAAKDMAVWHISMTLPQSIGGPIAGFILAAFGQYTLRGIDGPEKHYHFAGYAVVFTLSACAFALGALLLRNVRKAN